MSDAEDIENKPEGEAEEQEEPDIELKIQPASLFKKKYQFIKKLGNGAFAEVYLCEDRETHEQFAAKMIDRKASRETKYLWREIEIQSTLDHPNIIKLYETFGNSEFILLVLQLAKGGELYEKLLATENYTESNASLVICKLLEALNYLHSNGIVHRDIKPENILFKDDSINEPLLADFGLSGILTTDSMLYTCAGTPTFMAPEILKNCGYDSSCDMWSVGVLAYVLLSGQLPFNATSPYKLYQEVLKGHFEFSSEFQNISEDAKDFINRSIIVDPVKRITVTEALRHKWIQNGSTYQTNLPQSRDCLVQLLQDRRSKRQFHETTLAVSFVSKLKTLSRSSKKRKETKPLIFFIGGPGCGKGTQSEKIIQNFDIGYMSAGDLLRKEASKDNEKGRMLKELMIAGKIVSPDIIIDLLKEEIVSQGKSIYLIDGFPRDIPQIQSFEEKVYPGKLAIYLKVPDEILIERLKERSKTSGREDDNDETIKKRIQCFHDSSEKVFDYFKESGRGVEIDGNRDPDSVFADVKKVIETHFYQ